MKYLLTSLLLLSFNPYSFCQYKSNLPAQEWVDSVYGSLSKKQRIAQLMIIRAHSNKGQGHIDSVAADIKKYNVGGLCFFQGGPVRQAKLTNYYQFIAKTPLLITIDGEWGLGMRLDSVISFPHQLMTGAVQDASFIHKMGQAIGEQCRRIGIHVNFAPVVDINNNPSNPVINDRSFGEDKYKVALFGVEYMKGLQEAGVMGCAKHFPGHGDVTVDSHNDLPVIIKTRKQLDSLELYPFREMIKAGVKSMMIAHLFIPAIDSTPNQPTSLSYNNVTGVLRNELDFKGLSFTDALEMKGVTKFYPSGDAAAQSLIAGNDMICLPEDIKGSIKKIRKALRKGKINKQDFEASVRKVLAAKYEAGLNNTSYIDTTNLVNDLNKNTAAIKADLAENSITLLKLSDKTLLPLSRDKKIAFLNIGLGKPTTFSNNLRLLYGADIFTYGKNDSTVNADSVLALVNNYDRIVIGLHAYSRRPANNFGITPAVYNLINTIQANKSALTVVFGNPYAIKNISGTAKNLIACYEDDDATQTAATDLLQGIISAKGKLPVTVASQYAYGSGIMESPFLPHDNPESVGMDSNVLNRIDSVVNDAIAKKATPGCVVLVAKDGKVIFDKSYGYTFTDNVQPVSSDMIYDLASVTKVAATTIAIMKLYEDGKLDLSKTLGDYLPWTKGSNKENLTINNVLMHQAGMKAWIPFYEKTVDKEGMPLTSLYRYMQDDTFSVKVAEGVFMRKDYVDSMYRIILKSSLGTQNTYEYSDLDFIMLAKVVESITGQPLEKYVRDNFYLPLQMTSTTFKPLEHFSLDNIAPTAYESSFRQQLLRGDVHDFAAAMFGGVAGHAGLFSNAYDLAKLFQMLLNGGEINGVRYFQKSTIEKFTSYNSNVSRRGLGFDKPEKDNDTRANPYPDAYASAQTFGHTGFTGTCVWADPASNLVYIFLSNRVAYDKGDNNKLLKMKVRSNIQDLIYKSMGR